MTPSHESNVEFVTKHSAFRNVGLVSGGCVDCGFKFIGKSPGNGTRVAKLHVDQNPTHRVVTRRVQEKTTHARKVTVLR